VADITQDGAAESAVNLASELASFMVGSVVMADGGMTVTAG
jgi:enoyl-[acyl-carrier-protein] reductase (NADH)